jgi:large subunit ribosomal protein L4
MITIPVYNQTGERVGEESIDPALFGGEVNKQLLHDVVVMHLANRRVGTVNTRGRADVAGSGKKLFRQKGTGNARAGSKRTNKRKGGGSAFARRNRYHGYDMPKKAVRLAVRMALLSKFQDGQALIVEGFGTPGPADAKPKTKAVAQVLRALPRPDAPTSPQAEGETKKAQVARTFDRRKVLIGLPEYNPVFYQSARNLEGVMVAPVSEFNTYDVLRQRYLILSREAFEALKAKISEPVRRRPEPELVAAHADGEE